METRAAYPGLSALFKGFLIACILCAASPATPHAGVLKAEQVIRLQKAGAGKELITHIIESQAISRALVSFQDVLTMKENGVSDDIIRGIIDAGNPTVKELAKEDAYDRKLQRHIQRQKQIIQLQRKRQQALVDFLNKLIHNQHLQKLVQEKKISGDEYRHIVRYLKQYARDEPTYDWDDDGDINIDVRKKHQ